MGESRSDPSLRPTCFQTQDLAPCGFTSPDLVPKLLTGHTLCMYQGTDCYDAHYFVLVKF